MLEDKQCECAVGGKTKWNRNIQWRLTLFLSPSWVSAEHITKMCVNKRNVHLNICHRLQKQILSRCVKNMTHADNWTNRWRVFYTFQYVYVQHDLFNNLFLSCYVYDTFLCDRQNKNSEVFPFRKWIRPSYVQFHRSMKQLT